MLSRWKTLKEGSVVSSWMFWCSLLEPASSGQSVNCSFWHLRIGFLFQVVFFSSYFLVDREGPSRDGHGKPAYIIYTMLSCILPRIVPKINITKINKSSNEDQLSYGARSWDQFCILYINGILLQYLRRHAQAGPQNSCALIVSTVLVLLFH